MSHVKSALVISDVHLGYQQSYLYSPAPQFSHNRTALLELLRRLGPQDEFIINGDFLELALGSLDEVYRDARLFFEMIAAVGPYQKIVFLPGNHDHHFWRYLVEEIYIHHQIRRGMVPPPGDTFPNCFIDQRFSSQDPALPPFLFSALWPPDRPQPNFVVKYPHHLLEISGSADNPVHYLLTHGHFLENLFKPVDFLIESARLEELEAFNNLWLEVFNYHLGHAGRLSEKVKLIEEGFQLGGLKVRQDVSQVLNEVFRNMKRKLKLKWPKTWLLRFSLRFLVNKIPLEKQSDLFGVAINAALQKQIRDYLKKYILLRYQAGNAKKYQLPVDADIPTPFTFIFGHTHAPYCEVGPEQMVVKVQGKKYPIINTGGWLRIENQKAREGATAGVLQLNASGAQWHSLAGLLA